ncbi:MAG: CAP domain-containing protein [Deltaproteobacteria bacterium]|jgi:uncharacterized protein YkwD|nr:CAP domain-containing protein [Deltaproteobacteria bacterium]
MDERRRVLDMANQLRKLNGRRELSWNEALAGAAQLRAREILQSFSHERPGGGGIWSVLAEFGIRTDLCGENIAWGQKDAASVMNTWVDSRPHLENIVNPGFGQLGVGAVPHPRNGLSWVQLFIR